MNYLKVIRKIRACESETTAITLFEKAVNNAIDEADLLYPPPEAVDYLLTYLEQHEADMALQVNDFAMLIPMFVHFFERTPVSDRNALKKGMH